MGKKRQLMGNGRKDRPFSGKVGGQARPFQKEMYDAVGITGGKVFKI